ncbi:MAG: hypothetical protein IPL59_26765 [Candidatus Competibacteraceae bacterium]|nr:hypothetical protein [Candidatus Competibacteraceae bacterium]
MTCACAFAGADVEVFETTAIADGVAYLKVDRHTLDEGQRYGDSQQTH